MSRTARFAAVLILAQAGLAFASPRPAAAATPFECGDPGDHYCCIDAPECPDTHTYCCHWTADGDNDRCGCLVII